HLWGLVPLILYLAAFTLVPVVSTLLLGFRDDTGHWGLGALRTIAAHYQFNDAVVNTLAITGLGLSLELCLGLAAASLLAGRWPAGHPARAVRGGADRRRWPVAPIPAHHLATPAASPDYGGDRPRRRRLPYLCPAPGPGGASSTGVIDLCLRRVSGVWQPAHCG